MSDFNINTAIRELLDNTTIADPRELAEKLLADMDSATRAEAFTQTASLVVNVHMTRDRARTSGTSEPGRPTVPGQAARSKADLVREWWRAELRQRFRGAQEWLLLGEFAPADHEYAAQERRERAATIEANAAWHELCAARMRQHCVDRFDQLPAEVLSALIARRRPE